MNNDNNPHIRTNTTRKTSQGTQERTTRQVYKSVRTYICAIFAFYAFLYVLVPRRYTVRYLYILPGEKNTTGISLPEIGNADTSSDPLDMQGQRS